MLIVECTNIEWDLQDVPPETVTLTITGDLDEYFEALDIPLSESKKIKVNCESVEGKERMTRFLTCILLVVLGCAEVKFTWEIVGEQGEETSNYLWN